MILSSTSPVIHGADFIVLCEMRLAFNRVVKFVFPKSVCIPLKVNAHALFVV
jgi:hypothetical protein